MLLHIEERKLVQQKKLTRPDGLLHLSAAKYHCIRVYHRRCGCKQLDLQCTDFCGCDNCENQIVSVTANQETGDDEEDQGSISKPTGRPKPIVWIDSGIHAREWISPATNQYFIHQLLTKYAEDSQVQNFVDQIEWHILPVVNPDGYEYSHTRNRMWRKSRSGPIHGCYGVDLNRNYDFKWMEIGASSLPCSGTFAGPTPESDIETRNLRDYVLPLAKDMKAFITIHSYSQLFLTPWGHTTELPSDNDDVHGLGVKATNALTAVHGTEYRSRSDANT
ncbi:PREDICTED: carboxypeptidase B-like, partial [Priapulus caudatus]|uniref:Carboxypeptidase B-like n=1 Tax=Priapulus caudatus TaxID=37621 RepID=A0ABM1EW27_PRICU